MTGMEALVRHETDRPPGPTSRGRAVSLGMPAVHVPARPCDSSPLATVL